MDVYLRHSSEAKVDAIYFLVNEVGNLAFLAFRWDWLRRVRIREARETRERRVLGVFDLFFLSENHRERSRFGRRLDCRCFCALRAVRSGWFARSGIGVYCVPYFAYYASFGRGAGLGRLGTTETE